LLLAYCFLSVLLHKFTKSRVTKYVWFCNLPSCWCLTNNTISWGRKIIILLLQVVWRIWRKNHLFSPRVRYKPSSHPCGENFSCCITLRLESQRVTFKEYFAWSRKLRECTSCLLHERVSSPLTNLWRRTRTTTSTSERRTKVPSQRRRGNACGISTRYAPFTLSNLM
jgi:hypothetical protein